MAKGIFANNDFKVTGLNNNDVIIGPSGAGKTSGYVIPNIRIANESIVVIDPKGNLQRKNEKNLKKRGFKIEQINFKDLLNSKYGYNPFDFIKYDEEKDKYYEQDIITVARYLSPIEDKSNPFWENAAKQYIECLLGYILECLPKEEQNFDSVLKLFNEMGSRCFDTLMRELLEINPNSFAGQRYLLNKSTKTAEKMYESIRGIIAEKITPFMFDGARAMINNEKRIDFKRLGEKKTALFVNISDIDRSMDSLIGLFYSQMFNSLMNHADSSKGEQLKVPVRVILDDFATNFCITDFDKISAQIRSRGISVSIILQSISQLEGMYGKEKAITILNNCDHMLYLGGQDVETARYISDKANKCLGNILNMPLNEAYLFERGTYPRKVEKYSIYGQDNEMEIEI